MEIVEDNVMEMEKGVEVVGPGDVFQNNQAGITNWPPSHLEIESLITGQAIHVKVHIMVGEQGVLQTINESTDVE